MIRRVLVATVALLLLVNAIAALATPAHAQARVNIGSVTTSEATPEPGEAITVTTTINNLDSSDGPVEITDVYLRRAGGVPEYARVEDLGSIGVGGTMDVPLAVSFRSPGRKDLRVSVVGKDDEGQFFQRRYPLQIEVEPASEDVQLSFSTDDAVAGVETAVSVTVANGDTQNVSNLHLALAGEALSIDDARRVSATLDGEAERTYTYDVTFEQAGDRPLTATLRYEDPEGDVRTVTASRTIAVDPATVDAGLAVSVANNGTRSVIRAELSNFGNVPLDDVEIRVSRSGRTVARALMAPVDPQQSRRLTLDPTGTQAGVLRVVAIYTATDDRQRTVRTLDYAPAPQGRIELTGISVTQTGPTLTIAGTASNVGVSDASSVVLRTVRAEGVTPAPPSRDYFVGALDSSEFATFELTVETEPGTTTVPVRIQFVVDGERRSRTVTVDVSETSGPAFGAGGPPEGGPDGPPGGGPFGALGRVPWGQIGLAIVGIIAVLGGVYWLWARRG